MKPPLPTSFQRIFPLLVFLALVFPLMKFGLLPAPSAAAQQTAPPTAPKLVVVIVVDQMRADYIQRFRGEWHSGLARLAEQGAWFRNAAYPYSGTETCPGHATIATGVFPSMHGIVGNTWWDRQATETVTCTQDAVARDLGVGRTASPGDSPARLLAPSFAERLRAAETGSRVVTMSLKARAAIMLAGRHADVVLWQDEVAGDWLTSSAYSSGIPVFARDFFFANPLSADSRKIWNPSVAEHDGKDDSRSVAGEAPPPGWTTSFPHPLAGNGVADQSMVGHWRTSPFSDEYLGRLAAASVDAMQLGHGPQTDFLGVSFSAPDYVGHAFGPGSLEIEDELFRLDQTIGRLLDDLDRAVGAGKYVVALTADHGVAPIPEQSRSGGGRVDARSIVAAIEKVLDQRLGAERDVSQMTDQNIYLAPGVMTRVHSDPQLWRAIQAAVRAVPGVQTVFQGTDLGKRVAADRLEHAAALSEFPARSGDIVLALKPYWILSSLGTTHGTANEYDRDVPLILFGAGIKPGIYAAASSPADIAPTLSSLCGIPPVRTQGRILAEALQR